MKCTIGGVESHPTLPVKAASQSDYGLDVFFTVSPWSPGARVTVDVYPGNRETVRPCEMQLDEQPRFTTSVAHHKGTAMLELLERGQTQAHATEDVDLHLSLADSAEGSECLRALQEEDLHLKIDCRAEAPPPPTKTSRSPPPPSPSPPPPLPVHEVVSPSPEPFSSADLPHASDPFTDPPSATPPSAGPSSGLSTAASVVLFSVIGLSMLALLFIGTYQVALWCVRRFGGGDAHGNKAQGKPVRLPTNADDEMEAAQEEDDISPRQDCRDRSPPRDRSRASPRSSRDTSRDTSREECSSSPHSRSNHSNHSNHSSHSSHSHRAAGSAASPAASRTSRASREGSRLEGSQKGCDDDDSSEVASRLALRMNTLLDTLAPVGTRRRARIDGAVRSELQGGADPVDILEALELESRKRKGSRQSGNKRGGRGGGGGGRMPEVEEGGEPSNSQLAVSLSQANLLRLKRIQEAAEDEEPHLEAMQAAATSAAIKEEASRPEAAVQNLFKVFDDTYDDPQDAVQPWDSISNVLPTPSVIYQHAPPAPAPRLHPSKCRSAAPPQQRAKAADQPPEEPEGPPIDLL